VVIHGGKDDYMTDPAGNAGNRIACGVIGHGSTTWAEQTRNNNANKHVPFRERRRRLCV
jgi:hypothetical protein